jgi:hypothetical protein
MKITRQQLQEAEASGVLPAGQGEALWQYLGARHAETPSFRPAHILYYLGGLVAMGAMTLFLTLGWEQHGANALLAIAASYALLGVALTEWFLNRRQLPIPAGITAALAVAMVPLVVYALQLRLGLWPEAGASDYGYHEFHTRIDWRWIYMELATLAAGAVALWRWRLPFIVMPVAVAAWYLSMDLAPFLLGGDPFEIWSTPGKWVSVVAGLLMLVVAFFIDVRTRRQGRDFGFWLHVFGVIAFWGGLTAMDSHDELGKAIYCLINLAMIAKGTAISRRVFAIFGAIGVALYLGHLSRELFRDSLLFPVALGAIGFAIIAVGVWWQRNEVVIGMRLRALWPRAIRELIERSGA